MPVYDYRCERCEHVEEDVFVHRFDKAVLCPKCDEQDNSLPVVMTRLFTAKVFVDVFPNGGVHLKNVCAGGKTFYSRGEMKRYARKHNLELGALL